MRAPVCEVLGIEQPVIQAAVGGAAVPRLAAAVSHAGALGMVALTWTADVGGVVSQTAARPQRPFGGNLVLQWDQHRRLDQALEAGPRVVSLPPGGPPSSLHPTPQGGAPGPPTGGSAGRAPARGAPPGRPVLGPRPGAGRRTAGA